ncbi:unnamed protein product, partial [Phaeothamnion confervicola]
PSQDQRYIYVSSSSGSDLNTGFGEAPCAAPCTGPVASLAKAMTLMRNGQPDWMLLKKGDSWTAAFGELKVSGASAARPML